MKPNPNTWKNPVQTEVVHNTERDIKFEQLCTKYSFQAKQFAEQNSMKVRAFISSGFQTQVLNAKNILNAAKYIANNEPHFLPDTLPDDPRDRLIHEAAFIVALSRELSDPKYNQ
jgi:hypothetical protein